MDDEKAKIAAEGLARARDIVAESKRRRIAAAVEIVRRGGELPPMAADEAIAVFEEVSKVP